MLTISISESDSRISTDMTFATCGGNEGLPLALISVLVVVSDSYGIGLYYVHIISETPLARDVA